MDNKYELIINLNEETKKVYEKYFKDEEYQILVNEDNLIFAKKVNNSNKNFKNENEIINFAINMAKKQRTNGILYINLDKEILSKTYFKLNISDKALEYTKKWKSKF